MKKVVWQLGRVAVLLLLLAAIGYVQHLAIQPWRMISHSDLVWPWLVSAALVVVFLVIALVGRNGRQSRIILLVEMFVSATFGLMPPSLWLQWFFSGPLDWLPDNFLLITGAGNTNGFAAAVSIAWLVAAGMALVRRVGSDAQEGLPG
ncbi:hypothetical protein ER308_01895 [Egibacter rhizosphaerae]|uniref:Uncharacterized protein n=1 Tax=Egibacter rhizosphaerae TaxID=1670831 RepID=A0A411YB51_9ACTN|nr:hypothetical protein [Egibacter rhizosphaerae]QBI18441.1 hypothetical protein ER308_01895 [Egibacter rhizosphaerae]